MIPRLLLFFLLLTPVWSESLEAYARRSKCSLYYGLYILGSKVGWMNLREENVKLNGRTFHLAESVRYIERKSGLFGGKSVNRGTSREYYEVTGQGHLFRAEAILETDGRKAVSRLERKGKDYWLQRPGQAPLRLPLPRHNLREGQMMEVWVRGAKVGQSRSQWSLSLEQEPIEHSMSFKLLGKQSIVWGGVPTTTYQLEFKEEGMTGQALMRADGQLWKLTGGPMEIRAEPKAVAQRLDSNVDMLAAASIRVNRNLGHPSKVANLRLKVENYGDFAFPQSPRQKLQGKDLLVLSRDRADGPAETLSPADRKSHLSSSDSVVVNSRMRKLSQSILKGSGAAVLDRAGRLQHWVYQKLDKTYSKNATNALQVLENQAGDCTEHTILFVSLARSAGIPAREIGGLMYVPGMLGGGSFAWHAWAEVYTGRRWVGVDATFDENLIDATHIKMSNSPHDMAWMQVLGKLKLTVVD